MQANSQCHKYSDFTWPFDSGKCGKEKKLQKIEYLHNEKGVIDARKSIFHHF